MNSRVRVVRQSLQGCLQEPEYKQAYCKILDLTVLWPLKSDK